MKIGIPKEVKEAEFRVGLTPDSIKALSSLGHEVLVEKGLGDAIGFSDEAFVSSGAKVSTVSEVWQADLIVKVKEPQEEEFPLLREGQILFCFLHLAPSRALTEALIRAGTIAIAYETVTDEKKQLPLLAPMSLIAGRLSIQQGAKALEMASGGKGMLLGGVPGVLPGKVLILGGGVVGREAAKLAIGFGADVTVVDKQPERLISLDQQFGSRLKTAFSLQETIEKLASQADLIIGAVLVPGKLAPRLITRTMLRSMERGSAFVDVSIDQGGCSETSRPTTHQAPTYIEEGVVHYAVTNMPGACSKTASLALSHATLPYVEWIAASGWKEALRSHPGLRAGLNIAGGKVTNEGVASALGFEYIPPERAL